MDFLSVCFSLIFMANLCLYTSESKCIYVCLYVCMHMYFLLFQITVNPI